MLKIMISPFFFQFLLFYSKPTCSTPFSLELFLFRRQRLFYTRGPQPALRSIDFITQFSIRDVFHRADHF